MRHLTFVSSARREATLREIREIRGSLWYITESLEIRKDFTHLHMVEMTIDHLSGKEAIELVRMRNPRPSLHQSSDFS
jgi:hypothetical protein